MKRLLLFLLLVTAPAHAREGFVTVEDGVRLFYKIEGRGPETLVVVHGGPGFSLESVRADFGPLAAHRRVIYYDQRGNGRSTLIGDAGALALPRHIADLEALRRHFGLEKMALLGNSWGGLLISAYAAAHPDRVQRLVLDVAAPPNADVIPLAASREWAASYPNARLLLMRRSGHLAHLEEPDAFFAAVDDFLAGRWPEGGEAVARR